MHHLITELHCQWLVSRSNKYHLQNQHLFPCDLICFCFLLHFLSFKFEEYIWTWWTERLGEKWRPGSQSQRARLQHVPHTIWWCNLETCRWYVGDVCVYSECVLGMLSAAYGLCEPYIRERAGGLRKGWGRGGLMLNLQNEQMRSTGGFTFDSLPVSLVICFTFINYKHIANGKIFCSHNRWEVFLGGLYCVRNKIYNSNYVIKCICLPNSDMK